jgi:2',3'-cyclic-nucleotide 2'-phosphodiesterase (5'-nucleotidase family)
MERRCDVVRLSSRVISKLALLVALVAAPLPGRAATLAGWDTHAQTGGTNNFGTSPLPPAITAPNLTVGGLTRGPGVGTTGTGAARGWGGNGFTSATRDAAVAAGQVATFTVTAGAGSEVSFSSISRWDYRRSATGPGSGTLQVQVGSGAFSDVVDVSYVVSTSAGGSIAPIDLSAIAALQNVAPGTPVTFRIVSWGGTSSSGTWYLWDLANTTSNDLEVQGSVAPSTPRVVSVETAPDGTGSPVAAQQLAVGTPITVYAVARDGGGGFKGNVTATWSLASIAGGIALGDLAPAADGLSATFTPHAPGSAVVHAEVSGLASVDSGAITAISLPIDPIAVGSAAPYVAAAGDTVLLTVAVAPGMNPPSTGLSVQGDLSTLGGPGFVYFHDDGADGDLVAGDGVWSYQVTLPEGLAGGLNDVPVWVTDAQGRRVDGGIAVHTVGSFTVLHVNDTHARLTPHKWIIPSHGTSAPVFEDVGGAAYLAGAMLELTAAQPNALVIDAGDISEGNPVGDMNGNGSMTQFYQMLSAKLLAQRGRGMDAVVVGNHDVRDASYVANLDALRASGVPVISANLRDVATHQPHFDPYTIVTVHGTKVGLLGYTTEAAEVGASLVPTLEVAAADWNGTDPAKVHIAPYVNLLRNGLGCDVVILVAHVGDSRIATTTGSGASALDALLQDDGAAKLPEIVVTGHWHTWAETVWQPESLGYKTIITESNSYMHYIGELQVTGTGRYLGSIEHPIRDASYTPDPEVDAFVQGLVATWNAAHAPTTLDSVIGYTADDLMLDNRMKWWSADEYPWSGDNTAGQWICDAMQWKAVQLFGQADLAMETGGGVRADIPAGPVTYLEIYETFPWADDTFYRVNMTGQEIVEFLKVTGMDAGFSRGLKVTAFDGLPTYVELNGAPIEPLRTYTVAINSYMYAHPPSGWTWSDQSPLTSATLCRDGLVDFMRNFPTAQDGYTVGGPRYDLNTEFAGGYYAVVTMMNDGDTRPAYEDAFIRLLGANAETLARRGSPAVPADLVRGDGSINASHHLAEQELYRSYLGFKRGVLRPGDILEVWGKGSFYQGNPEFVDQEGVYGDGIEFHLVGHDDSLAKPTFMRSIGAFWDDFHKNHYVKFLARKAGVATVTDQLGRTIKLWDETAYAAKAPIPGNVGDLLVVTGVPTMESWSLRFRCHTVTLAASEGITDFPAESTVSSTMEAVFPVATDGAVTLVANASPASETWTLAPVADAQVASGRPDTNYGTTTNIYLQSSASGYGNERGWLRFDLSAIPAGATIASASLDLWCWKASGPVLDTEVHGGDSDAWLEAGAGAITWNNQPTFGGVLATQTLAATSANLWYSWDVSAFVAQKWAANKLVSLVVKPSAEGSSASTAPSYGFDAKEYGSNAPMLTVRTQPAPGVAVGGVDMYYRYSVDGVTWSDWTLAASCASAPCTPTFAFPDGYGYYEFYSAARDGSGATEAVVPYAQSFVHYVASPPYPGGPVDSVRPALDPVAVYVDATHADVTFDSNVAGADLAASWSASGGRAVLAATPRGGNVYRLTTTYQPIGSTTTFTASPLAITDVVGNPLLASASTATVVRGESGPSIPAVSGPADGSEVTTLTPALAVTASSDPDGDPISYTFQVFADPQLTVTVAAVTGAGSTWSVAGALADNTTYWWRALATDGVVSSTWTSTARFFVNTVNDAPGPVAVSAPADGTQVGTTTPTLAVTNATDVDGDALTYEFEVYRDAALTSLVTSVAGLAQGAAGVTSWTVDAELANHATYWWTARARDEHGLAGPAVMARLLVSTGNGPPTAPGIAAPADGAEVAALDPILVVTNATDPEGDALVYTFQIDRVQTFDSAAKQEATSVAPGVGTTSWRPATLLDNTTYYWRAKASDGRADGPWSTVARIFVNTANDPPSTPTVLAPAPGAQVTVLTPTLSLNASVDPDGDALTYEFEVYADAAMTTSVASTTGAGTSWVAPALPDKAWYTWRARARDEHGAASAWTPASTFLVNASGYDVPPTIAITSPAAPLTTSAASYTIRWTDFDPDSNASITIGYDRTGSGCAGTPIATGIPEDDPANAVVWDLTALPPGTYHPYAFITDGTSSACAYGAALTRPAPATPEHHGSGGCASGSLAGAESLLAAIGFVLARRRRRG